jgi:FixJ family two-component response regulator
MTGLEFLRTARVLCPDTVRILVTGHADLDVAVRAINEDAVYRFIHKPWDPDQLKLILHLAARRVEAAQHTSRLMNLVREQANTLAHIERQKVIHASIPRDAHGAVLISDEEESAAASALLDQPIWPEPA